MNLVRETTTVEYEPSHRAALKKFCEQAGQQGLSNNSSLDNIKLDKTLDGRGTFFLTFHKKKIISMSGCHAFPEVGHNTARVLFRGATLNEYKNAFDTMSKTHMNSFTFFYHLPLQLIWANNNNYDLTVITTNTNNQDTQWNKSYRAFVALEKTGIVTNVLDNMNIFSIEQSVWRLNKDVYEFYHRQFAQRHGL